MTTGPENPADAPDPGTPPTPNPYGAPPPPPYQPPATYQQPTEPPPYGWGGQQPEGAYGQPPAAYPQQYGYPVAPRNEGMGVAAMVTGIVALVLACAYGIGLLASPVALVLGKVSMNRIKRSQGQVGGRGFALTGFILGIIGTVLLVLWVVVLAIIIVVAIQDPNAFE
jgi:hypothetical protein